MDLFVMMFFYIVLCAFIAKYNQKSTVVILVSTVPVAFGFLTSYSWRYGIVGGYVVLLTGWIVQRRRENDKE